MKLLFLISTFIFDSAAWADPKIVPDSVIVDGKLKDWDKQRAGFNRSTEVFFQLTNSKTSLYLMIMAKDPGIIEKLLAGGLTFTVGENNKKSTNPPFAITYPIMPPPQQSAIVSRLKDKELPTISILAQVNAALIDGAKEMELTGLNTLSEKISIYNEYGIKAASLIDSNRNYCLELSIPASLISKYIKNNTLKYEIRLPGAKSLPGVMTVNGKTIDTSSPEGQALMALIAESSARSATTDPKGKVTISSGNPMQNLLNPTFFSKNYQWLK